MAYRWCGGVGFEKIWLQKIAKFLCKYLFSKELLILFIFSHFFVHHLPSNLLKLFTYYAYNLQESVRIVVCNGCDELQGSLDQI